MPFDFQFHNDRIADCTALFVRCTRRALMEVLNISTEEFVERVMRLNVGLHGHNPRQEARMRSFLQEYGRFGSSDHTVSHDLYENCEAVIALLYQAYGPNSEEAKRFQAIWGQGIDEVTQKIAPPLPTGYLHQVLRSSEDAADAACSICQESVGIHDKVAVLRCGHWFHKDCIKNWLGRHNSCPFDRQPAFLYPADSHENAVHWGMRR